MKNSVVYLFLAGLLLVSCNANKKEMLQRDENKSHVKRLQEEAYSLIKNKCYACHSVNSASHDEIIAPPLAAVKRRYMMSYKDPDDFITALTQWVVNPEKEKALMRGAVVQFNVMPKQDFKEEDIKKIANYMYHNALEEPSWFEAHEKEMHGPNRKRMGLKIN